MSLTRQKTPKRSTDAKAHKKGRGAKARVELAEHQCHLCGKRNRDKWGKVPRMKYGTKEGRAAHPECSPLVTSRGSEEYEARLNTLTPRPANNEAVEHVPPAPRGKVRAIPMK